MAIVDVGLIALYVLINYLLICFLVNLEGKK